MLLFKCMFFLIVGAAGRSAGAAAVSSGDSDGQRGLAATMPPVARSRSHAAHSLSHRCSHRQVTLLSRYSIHSHFFPSRASFFRTNLLDTHSCLFLFLFLALSLYRRVYAEWRADLVLDARLALMCRGIYAQIVSYAQAHCEARLRSNSLPAAAPPPPAPLALRDVPECGVECRSCESDADTDVDATAATLTAPGVSPELQENSLRLFSTVAPDESSHSTCDPKQHSLTLLEAARLYERQHISNL